MTTIAITGGKGGTGKTLIATNLAVQLAQDGFSVLLIDSDVENPNTNILLGHSLLDPHVEQAPVEIFTPKFDEDKCIQCGKCRDVCYRHAILQFKDHYPSLLDHMCSGCETCQRICPTQAISSKGKKIGKRYFLSNISKNLDLIVGELLPSEAVSVLIVEEILNFAEELKLKKKYDIILVDTAPGAHCDVEKSLEEANLILAVTEPTPFGLHDLKRILELIRLNNHTASVILNRADITDFKETFLNEISEHQLSILGEIPVDSLIIENYARGTPFITDKRSFPGKTAFMQIYQKVLASIKSQEVATTKNGEHNE